MSTRRHVGPVTKIAMSPTKISTATGLRLDRVISPAIKSGELPCYVIGNHRRVLISDVEAWLRTYPRLLKKVHP
jgi:hypothetical protein